MTETPEASIYEKSFAKSEKTDAILVVDRKKLHVNKALLSCHSDYFNTLFNSDFKENSMEEIEIKDVSFDEFATVLSLVHPNPIKPTAENAEKLLELADRFLLQGAKNYLELFIMSTTISFFEKLRIADKYNLEDLLNQAVNNFTCRTHFINFRSNPISQNVSDHCKALLFVRVMTLQLL